MKKSIVISLVCALMLCVALTAVPTADAVNTVHNQDHCVCGSVNGGVSGHTCDPDTEWTGWTAWSTPDALPNVDGGKFYLTTDVTLSGAFTITKDVTICLNGNKISSNGTKARAITVSGGSLSICDCSDNMTGVITSSGANEGGVIRVNANSELSIYSGSIIAGNVENNATKGGCIFANQATATINIYGGILTGCPVQYHGGCISADPAKLNVYGGKLSGGHAGTDGDCIFVRNNGAEANIYGGVIEGEIATSGSVSLTVTNIEGGLLKLSSDYAANITMQDDLIVDLNGKVLSGTINTNGHNLYIADSTAQVGGVGTGKMNAQITGEIMQGDAMLAYAGDVAGHRYVTVNGSVYRIYVGFDKIRLYKDDNGNIGMNYVTNFKMHDEVKALLTDDANGYAVGCKFGAAAPVGYSKENYKPDIATNISAILDKDGTDVTDFATAINATTFVNLTIGGQAVTIESNLYEYSLKDVYVQLGKIENGVITGGPLTGATKEIYDFIGTEYADVVATLNG